MLDVLRREVKYLISPITAQQLSSQLDVIMTGDEHNRGEGYMVRSLYFDTPNNKDFFDKQDGLEYRKKIRLRIYDTHDQFAKLELKEKQNLSQRKRSLILTKQEALQIINGEYECLLEKGHFSRELYAIMKHENYQPVCIVQYLRKAYICETNDTRITLDSWLSSHEGNYDLFDEDLQLYPIDLNGNITLEVKYNHFLLSYIKDVISMCDKLSLSSSKYCRSRIFGLKGE